MGTKKEIDLWKNRPKNMMFRQIENNETSYGGDRKRFEHVYYLYMEVLYKQLVSREAHSNMISALTELGNRRRFFPRYDSSWWRSFYFIITVDDDSDENKPNNNKNNRRYTTIRGNKLHLNEQ